MKVGPGTEPVVGIRFDIDAHVEHRFRYAIPHLQCITIADGGWLSERLPTCQCQAAKDVMVANDSLEMVDSMTPAADPKHRLASSASLKAEGQPPVGPHRHGPDAFAVTLERM